MERLFPKYVGQVIPLLRSASVKYENSTTHTIVANENIEEESKEKFISQFEKKGRASITVIVEITDIDDLLTLQGEFTWFVQKI